MSHEEFSLTRDLHFTQEQYDYYLAYFFNAIPFSDAKGKISPYTHQPIQDRNDYLLYGHCYALKHMTEHELRSIESSYQKSLEQLTITNKQLKSSNSQSVASNATLSQRYASLCRLCVAFFLMLIVLASVIWFQIVSPNPLSEELESLRSEVSVLKSSLADAEEQVVSLTELIDISYKEGYSDASKDYAVGPSNSHSYSHYDSSPVTDTTYIGNSSTKKFHRSDCSYLPSKGNQVPLMSRDYAISSGYEPCKRCDP